MARYRALKLIFIGSMLHQPGDEFESDLTPARSWHPLDPEARAAVEAQKFGAVPKKPGEHRTPLVEIPGDWRDMKPIKIINLARKLGLSGGKMPDAIAKIEAEEAARCFVPTGSRVSEHSPPN